MDADKDGMVSRAEYHAPRDGGVERASETLAQLRLRRAEQDSLTSNRALRDAQQAVAEERRPD